MMGFDLIAKKADLTNLFARGSNGVFICAGGYLAAGNYRVADKKNGLVTLLPANLDSALDVFPSFTAIGPFYPTNLYDNTMPSSPHSVELISSLHTFSSKQIYWEGCGFIPSNKPDIGAEVVATYSDKDTYTFNSWESYDRPMANLPVVSYKNMAAMIRNKSSEFNGGFFASGVHIEAGVSNSKLLYEATQNSKYLKQTARFFNEKKNLRRCVTYSFRNTL